jgi:hypothetical protein
MVKGKKDIASNGLFTMSRVGPETLTHKAVEDYLAKGRRMQSEYVRELLSKIGLRLRATLVRSVGWLSALPEQKCTRCIGIQVNRKSHC